MRFADADLDALKKTPDVGDITAEWIVDFFQAPHNLEVVERLARGIHWDAPVAPSRQPLNGGKWVVTGTLSTMGSDEATQCCSKHWGARVSGVFRSKTKCVVAGEKAGSKNWKKLKNSGIPVINEAEFY